MSIVRAQYLTRRYSGSGWEYDKILRCRGQMIQMSLSKEKGENDHRIRGEKHPGIALQVPLSIRHEWHQPDENRKHAESSGPFFIPFLA